MISLRTAAIALKNLSVGGNLAALRIATSPRAAVNYAGECLFLMGTMHPKGGLPQRHIHEVFNTTENLEIRLSPQATIQWFTPVASYGVDLVGLCMLARVVRPQFVFEIGTLEGSGALHLAMNAPGATVYTLDLPPGDMPSLSLTETDVEIIDWHRRGKSLLQGQPDATRIKQLYGDSATFDFSPYRQKIDLFFIDGAHSYEYVRNDTLKALECVRPGGVIAWHDYGRRGVNGISRWLHEFSKDRKIQRIPGGSLAYAVV